MIGVPFSDPANYLADALRLVNIPVGSMLIALMVLDVWRNHDDLTRRFTLLSGIAFVAGAVAAQLAHFGTPMATRTVLTFVGTVLGVVAAVRRVLEK